MAADSGFLGTGWSFPPAFQHGGAAVAMVSGAEDIQQSLQILFATRLGERIMQDSFGCALDDLVFEELDQRLINTLSSCIADAILYHEPRITLDQIDITEDAQQPGLLQISLFYTIRTTNSRFNMVYPFSITEASTL